MITEPKSLMNLTLENRHKFRTFEQIISTVSADISNEFRLSIEEPQGGDNGTFFFEYLSQSLYENLDTSYAQLSQKLIPISRSLALVFWNKDKIFELLIEYLNQPYDYIKAGIDNVMTLITHLARDLRTDFYPYFERIFLLLASLFKPETTDFVQAFFRCISFMFRFLLKPLLEDHDHVIKLVIQTYFNHDLHYCRRLMAEILGYFLRQMPKLMNKEANALMIHESQEFGSTLESDDNVRQTLALTMFFEIKNVGNTLRSNAKQLINAFLPESTEYVFDIFKRIQIEITKHVQPESSKDYINSLAKKLPQIDANISLQVFEIWIQANEGVYFKESSILVKVLDGTKEKAEALALAHFLFVFNSLKVDPNEYSIISNSVVRLLSEENCAQCLEILKESSYIAGIVCQAALDYATLNFKKFLPNLLLLVQWIKPNANQVPNELVKNLNSLITKDRNLIIPILSFVHSKESYQIISKLKNISLQERKVYYELMGIYDKESVIEEPKNLLELIGDDLENMENLQLLLLLINICVPMKPEWLTTSSQIFLKLLNGIHFNIPDETVQRQAARILYAFVDNTKTIDKLNPYESICTAVERVFNHAQTLASFKEAEVWITRLANQVTTIPDTDKLYEIALGFSAHNIKTFHENATKLVSAIIKFEPEKYGGKTTELLLNKYPWQDNDVLIRTLLGALESAQYIDDNVMQILNQYCSSDKTGEEEVQDEKSTLIIKLVSAIASYKKDDKYSQQVEEAAPRLLRSANLGVRQVACDMMMRFKVTRNKDYNEQKRVQIKQTLNAFVNPKSQADTLTKFTDFVGELTFERGFVVSTAINLSIGVIVEYTLYKMKDKNKYRQLAQTVCQSLSFLQTQELAPLIDAFLPKDPSTQQLRRIHKFLRPLLSRLSQHLVNHLDEIANLLHQSLQLAAKSPTSNDSVGCCKIIATFIETYNGFETFSIQCLDLMDRFLDRASDATISVVHAISKKYPHIFENHLNIVDKVLKLTSIVNEKIAELVEIIGNVTLYAKSIHPQIIETLTLLLDNSKLFKRETVVNAFLYFMALMKEKFVNEPFVDLCIKFTVTYKRIETIEIVDGLELTEHQFAALCTLIAQPLEVKFREALVPLIAGHLGDLKDSFIVLNSDDIPQRTITYSHIQSAGKYRFVFALQAFGDLQINDFSLRSAAVGFLSRTVAEDSSIATDFVLPAIRFNLKYKHYSKVPPHEIFILLQAIASSKDDLLPSIKRIASQPFFLTLGSVDYGVRASAFPKFAEFIDQYDDWNREEFGDILLPLFCLMASTPDVDIALTAICKYSPQPALELLLKRLLRNLKHGQGIGPLGSLVMAGAFKSEDITGKFLNVIEKGKGTSDRTKLQLMTCLLSVNKSPRVIQTLTSYSTAKMVSQNKEIREAAKTTLKTLVSNLEPAQFLELFQSLRNNMHEGYQIPLKYYAFNIMVENARLPGSFDAFLGLLIDNLLEDIFGHDAIVRQTKSDNFPEAKKCHTFLTFQKLAEKVGFKLNAKEFIEHLLTKFDTLSTVTQSKGAQKLIRSVCDGFVANESVDAKLLVEIVSDLLERSEKKRKDNTKKNEEEEKIEYGKKYQEDIFIEKPVRSSIETSNQVMRMGADFLVSYFGVMLLYVFFEQDLFDIEDPRQVELLETLLTKLWSYTTSQLDADTLCVTLSIMKHYTSFKSFTNILPDVISFLTQSLATMSTATDKYGQAIFNLLTKILKDYPDLEFPLKFTRVLVTFCHSQIDIHESCEQIFNVLRMIMKRRQDIPEIYDVAKTALELIIRAVSTDVRTMSGVFVAEFMTTYKQSKNQYRDNLQFALGNLGSSKAFARRSLVDFFTKYLELVKQEDLDPFDELILAHFGARIANEQDENILTEIRKTIGTLLVKVSSSRFMSMWDLMIKWTSAGGNRVRTGLLLIAVAVSYCSEAMSSLLEALQNIVDIHIKSEGAKTKIAAIELHKQIISSYSEYPNTKLLGLKDITDIIKDKSTAKVGCQILFWYLSSYENYQPNVDEIFPALDELLSIVINWRGSIKEAADSMHLLLCLLPSGKCVEYMENNMAKCYEVTSSETGLALMRIVVGTVLKRECDDQLILRNTLKIISYVQDLEDTFKQAEKALEVLRQNVDPDVFGEEWTEIVYEKERKKKEEEEKKKLDEFLDPEEYQKRLHEEREREKIERRAKKYFETGQNRGTLYAYGPDGKEVEGVPLAKEFQ